MATILMAFVIRFVFAYGVSAGDNYALSGGASAASHLNTVISIMTGSFSFTDMAVNFPAGSLNVTPALMDFLAAGIASAVSMFGVSTATAAAGTLAWSAPILAALTCIPVYFVGKRMFKSENIGLISAVLYAFFSLMVMTTAFSNGTEYALAGFFFAWMVYFLLRATESLDSATGTGFKALFSNKEVLKNTVLAGLFFMLIALSWNQFRSILTCLVFFMVAQALIDRFRSKDVSLTVGMYSIVILIGAVVPALYYIPAGLWSAVFSGPFMVAVLSLAFVSAFAATSKKSWVFTIPILSAIAAAVLAVMYFAAPALFGDLVMGNSYYSGTLMSKIASISHNSISSMAAYFGWVTVWLPVLMFLYMLYKYRRNMDSRKYTFTMWFFFAMFSIAWFSVGNAFMAGIGFAVSGAGLMIEVLKRIDLKSYFAGLRGNGFKAGLKKAAKPIPLAAVVILAALIIAPNALYAIDAATPTNSEDDSKYFGGLGYTIQTSESSSMNKLWKDSYGGSKSGALVTWFNYSNDAVGKGGFKSVTDILGGGTSAMSNIILANGSAGATAAMAVRLMLSHNFSDYSGAISSSGLDYAYMSSIAGDHSKAIKTITSDMVTYPGYDARITGENAVYVVLSKYVTSTLCEPDVDAFYNKVCAVHGDKISYVAVNGSMIPMYYRDGSYFPTISYFNDYIIGDYGAISHFYSITQSTGYAAYKDPMFETFLWKSLVGISQKSAGFSDTSYFLSALMASDGTVKAVPGYGLSNYKVAYWHVMYNADSKATASSKGWADMDGYEALAKQKSDGGLINYLAGTVLMEYSESASTSYSGKINYSAAGGQVPAKGVEVAVYTKVSNDLSAVKYIPTCVVKTLDNGTFKIAVPNGTDYYIIVSTGARASTGGSSVATYTNVNDLVSAPLLLNPTSLSGYVSCDNIPYTEDTYVNIEGTTSGYKAQAEAVNGAFSFSNLMPDLYKVSAFKKNGTIVSAKEVSVCAGSSSGTMIDAKSGKLTVTVTDESGASVNSGKVVATDTKNGARFSADIVNGTANISVIPSVYTLSASGGKVAVSSATVDVTADNTKTSSLTVHNARTITVSGAPAGSLVTVMSLGFTASSASGSIQVPASGAGDRQMYAAYAVIGNTVYYGASAEGNITMASFPANTVTGTLKNKSDKATSGTVAFIAPSGAMLIFSADSDGHYKALLPSGDFSLYAFDNSGSAYLGSCNVTSNATNDIKMEASRAITVMFKYKTQQSSDATKGMAFADVSIKTSVGGKDHTVIMKTDTEGKVVFNMPSGHEMTLAAEAFDNSKFHFDRQTKTISSGSDGELVTWTLSANPGASDHNGMYVKYVTVSSSHEVKMTLYNDSSIVYTFTGSKEVMVGKYTTVVKGSTGYRFDGSVSVYPGAGGPLVMDGGKEVATVTLTAGAQDSVSVKAISNADGKTGSYYKDSDNANTYFVEKGYGYTFTATSNSSGVQTIAYGSVLNATANATVDLSAKAESVTVKGYVGLVADGTLTVVYPNASVVFDIKSGEFELTIPKGKAAELNAKVTHKDGKTTYTNTGKVNLSADAAVAGTSVRFFSATSDTAKDTILTGSNQVFGGGSGKFTLSIKNEGKYANTYQIFGGPAWILSKTYLLTVEAGATGSVEVSGRYNADKVGAGDANLSVTVIDVSGTNVGTYTLDRSGFAKDKNTATYIDVSGTKKAFADAVSTYEYLYAVTFTNNDGHSKTVDFTVAIGGDSGKWRYILSDEKQYILDSGQRTIGGMSSTVIYVKLLCTDASSTTVPGITVTAKMTGETLATNSASAVSINGDTATLSLSPQNIDVKSSDMSASGKNIYNTASTIPLSFWILMSVSVLLLIFIAWEGSKRGVFTRKK